MLADPNLGVREAQRGVDFCRSCNARNLFLGLDLGASPIANRLSAKIEGPVERFPLCMKICSNCGLGQVGEYESRETIFSDYPYLSSTSTTWVEENREFASRMKELLLLTPKDLVVEVASNDGYLLREFNNLSIRTLGVEPAANVAALAREAGVDTIAKFLGKELGAQISSEHGFPRLVVAKNVIAHVPDINDFVLGISELVGPDTLLVLESPTILQILDGLQFDTIYHEHFSYLSAQSMTHLFETHGMELVGIETLTSHGGSTRFFITQRSGNWKPPSDLQLGLMRLRASEEVAQIKLPKTWVVLQHKVLEILKDFHEWLSSEQNQKTYAFGAAAKGVTFLTAAGIGLGQIAAVIDNSVEKVGRFLPGLGIPIISESQFVEFAEAEVRFLILPWNLSDELTKRIAEIAPDAPAFTAIPEIKRVN